jgi:diguanylate cyclase (GGDEF)-like protein/PAS domain S-box-containing protein
MSNKPTEPDSLRAEAETQLARAPQPKTPSRSAEELLHELRVHQIELEMQNEELRRAQLIIEESRDRYMDLYDFAPVGYLTLTREALIAEVNLTGAKMLGVERKKLIHRRFAHFVAPQDRDRFHRYFMLAAQQGDRQDCELALMRGGGAAFHARLDCLRMKAGSSDLVRVTFADITERKHAEEELRIAATAFESQQGMIVTDPDGVILRVNQAFTRLTGYSAAEAIGRTPAMLQSGRQDEDFYRRMWETLKQKRYWQGEMWNKRKDGKIYAEWLTISAVAAPDGNVSHYVGTFSEITENKEAEAEIHRLAYYDALTGLPNRRLLLDRLEQAMAFTRRHMRYGAILFLDLDNFKTLNDTRGHDVGDLLLTEIAQRLQAAVREGDSIARFGGDEFVVLLENLSEKVEEAVMQVGLVGEKVQEVIAAPYMLKDMEFNCTASIGACLFCSHDESVDDLLRHADLAMYQAKKNGGNNLRFFDPAMQATLDERTAIEKDLRRALVKQQFRLYYQIQVTSTRRVIGAETLLRWEHPERGLISPLQFIPLAEETGLIVPIGLWVLHTACAQIKDWSGHPATRDLQLAVNVSPRQFHQTDFVEQVQQALAESGIVPARLKLELTESMVLDNVGETITKMQAIKALGVGFSMDDFGTGYSSLSYLKRLPLDQLKIDRSFVKDITTDPNDAAIIQTIIGMAHNLSLNVIAEGVETETQLELLNQYGCRAYQGYLFSRPVPVREFEKLLAQYA